jgi:hypothetical protein
MKPLFFLYLCLHLLANEDQQKNTQQFIASTYLLMQQRKERSLRALQGPTKWYTLRYENQLFPEVFAQAPLAGYPIHKRAAILHQNGYPLYLPKYHLVLIN